MNARRFLVTGGTGTLGSRMVDRLRAAGREVRVFSRSGGDGRVRGDLATGEGLEASCSSPSSASTATRTIPTTG